MINNPCDNPINTDTTTTANNASHGGQLCFTSNHGNPHPVRHTTDPIDRSIPPVMITNATPTPKIPYNAVRSSSCS